MQLLAAAIDSSTHCTHAPDGNGQAKICTGTALWPGDNGTHKNHTPAPRSASRKEYRCCRRR